VELRSSRQRYDLATRVMETPPERIGPYPIERELGRGGMGVVYLGRDPQLGRPVAVKVLPEAMAGDAERLARFDREARMLAAVHHPNVASIFGVGEDGGGRRYLALEYVPGESLAERLARAPLPVADAIAVCRDIAAGLEAAHEAGVVHRDLKPANVRLTPDGAAKVLDFGLAKGATAASSVSGSFAESPTRTYLHATTEKGVVLGTLTYMSPEQASGKPVDRRTDVWALGCILFECLSGRAPFAGNTATDAMVKILEREPPWETLPAATPARVRELLERCLEKDRNRRLRDAGDAKLELERAKRDRSSATGVTVVRPAARGRGRAGGLVAVALTAVVVAAGLGWWLGRREARWPATPLHVAITFPRDQTIDGWDLAPDGKSILFDARRHGDTVDKTQLYRRGLESSEIAAVPGTLGVAAVAFSPDGRWLYFVRQSPTATRLVRMPLDGSGPPADIVNWEATWTGYSVLANGDLLILGGNNDAITRVSVRDGTTGPTIPVDLGKGSWLRSIKGPPLPDGRVLFDLGSWEPRVASSARWPSTPPRESSRASSRTASRRATSRVGSFSSPATRCCSARVSTPDRPG
jgi:hypothetical protein